MFLFALFDPLAILPLTSHTRLERGYWEEWVLFAAAFHEWILTRKNNICPADSSSSLSLSLPSQVPPPFLRGVPLKCLALACGGHNPPPPEFLSHLSVHCECASMSFWKVCARVRVCILLVCDVFGNCTTWCCTVGVEHKQECMF